MVAVQAVPDQAHARSLQKARDLQHAYAVHVKRYCHAAERGGWCDRCRALDIDANAAWWQAGREARR